VDDGAVNAVLAFDHLARGWVVSHRSVLLDDPMWLLSVIGRGGMVWLAVAAAVAWYRSRPRLFLSLALAIGLASLVANSLLKPLVDRERPFDQDPAVSVIGGRPGDASFPSGHAANAFAGAIVFTASGGSAWWWALAVATAYSRVYLGVHYPLDVSGGAVVGLVCGTIALAVARAVVTRQTLRRESGAR
jgi:undecaprenyl-diphosphatase